MGRPTPDPFSPPPLPPSHEPTPIPPWHAPPPSSPPSDPVGELIMLLIFAIIMSPFIFLFACGPPEEHRENRDRAEAPAPAAAAAPTAPPRALPPLQPSRHYEELRRLRQARAANPAARCLPAFRYNRTVKHSVTPGGGEEEEAATCSVCLGVFQLGEMVRLLPLCLHLYHAECIDAWLDAHSTCPICRSHTVPTTDVARPPPV